VALHLGEALELPSVWTHVWWWLTRLPERKGQPCRVLAYGKLNNILVEFSDGLKVVTSRHAVRRTKRRRKRA
jgi:hypothetical protein